MTLKRTVLLLGAVAGVLGRRLLAKKRTEDEADAEYRRTVAAALNRVFDDEKEEQQFDLRSDRLVIFSDHHKGSRDRADDFRGCERAYAAALGYYLDEGFRLFALGDVEELWECSPKEVIRAYPEILQLEAEFHKNGRYERFWGNHDLDWSEEDEVAKYLNDFYPGIRVREARKLRVVDDGVRSGLLFFVHGHQGTLDSDRWAWLSRPVVRHLWRPLQRYLNMYSTQPSRDFQLRKRHEDAMFEWARNHPQKPVLIAGHTHRPVFWLSAPPPPNAEGLQEEYDAMRRSGTASADELATLHAQLEYALAQLRENGEPPIPIDPPCYFNTGCCSFGDGDVTGIEIADGEIRLVRWPDNDGEPAPQMLVIKPLAEVLGAVGA